MLLAGIYFNDLCDSGCCLGLIQAYVDVTATVSTTEIKIVIRKISATINTS